MTGGLQQKDFTRFLCLCNIHGYLGFKCRTVIVDLANDSKTGSGANSEEEYHRDHESLMDIKEANVIQSGLA